MKIFKSLMILSLGMSAAHASVLDKGIFKAIRSNTKEVCDQAILPITLQEGSKTILHSLKVYYVGHCGEMGPYFYGCESKARELQCGDGVIEFTLKGKNRYKWKNRPHGFEADFVLKKKL